VDKRDRSNRGYATKVGNLSLNPTSIHSKYRSELCEGDIAENGRLDVLKLVRKDGGRPCFSARWDQKSDALDIDIHHPSRDVCAQFKHGENGYCGHWTKPTGDPNSRTFEIVITTPEGMIFEGTASFTLTRQFHPSDQLQMGDHLEAEVVRANRNCDAE
jgi:hypothetical protein